jgi:carotenoid cleavage dioxygenase-like enzyme
VVVGQVDPSNGDVHFMGQGFFSPVVTYGVLDADMQVKHKLSIPFAFPPPAFLHDYFLTPNYMIVVDHSLRVNPGGLVPGKLYEFQQNFNVRFGLIPRTAKSPAEVR